MNDKVMQICINDFHLLNCSVSSISKLQEVLITSRKSELGVGYGCSFSLNNEASFRDGISEDIPKRSFDCLAVFIVSTNAASMHFIVFLPASASDHGSPHSPL